MITILGKKATTKTKANAKAKAKAKAKATAKAKKKKTKRGRGFSLNEIDLLLELAEKYLPLTIDAWNSIERDFRTYFPEMDRDAKSLKRKFDELCHTKAPTGDPNCPPNVRRAKHIKKTINDILDFSDGGSG